MYGVCYKPTGFNTADAVQLESNGNSAKDGMALFLSLIVGKNVEIHVCPVVPVEPNISLISRTLVTGNLELFDQLKGV